MSTHNMLYVFLGVFLWRSKKKKKKKNSGYNFPRAMHDMIFYSNNLALF